MEEIARIGPGGNYLISDLTLKRFRQAIYQSDIWPTLTLEEWQENGRPRADDLLRARIQQLLDQLEPPEDHADLMARGEAFIHSLGR